MFERAKTLGNRNVLAWSGFAAVFFLVIPLAAWTLLPGRAHSQATGLQGSAGTGGGPSGAAGKPAKSARIVVPDEVATVSEALARSVAGGIIEVHGGIYREAITVTKGVTIQASTGAVLEPDTQSGCPLSIKGNGAATIQGLTIRDAGGEPTGDLENKPPLILVTNGASLILDQCVIEGSQGNGITIMAKSRATLSACRILRNADCGIQLNSGGSAVIAQTSLLENRVGISLAGATTSAQMTSGSSITRSQINGVELHESAAFSLSSSEISASQERNGVFATGSQTTFHADKSVIQDNQTHGLLLEHEASAQLDHCKVLRNHQSGILATAAGNLAASECSFENTLSGIFVDGAASLLVRDSLFSNHAECGLTARKVRLEADGNVFRDNGIAILIGREATGELSNNQTTKPPAQAIVIEGGGKFNQAGNTQIR